MRHIKLFEGFGSNEYYKEVHEYEWERLDRQEFKFPTINKIWQLFPNYSIQCDPFEHELYLNLLVDSPDISIFNNITDEYEEANIEELFSNDIMDIVIDDNKNNRYTIGQLPDEYYSILHTNFMGNGGLSDEGYYKCDQWEGLVKFLKDRGLI